MESIWTQVIGELQAGHSAVLLTIVATVGSTPRRAGSRQLVLEDGTTRGTIGGGYQEYLAIEEGKRCLLEMTSRLKTFLLHPAKAGDIGAVCGGEVTVFCQYIEPTQQRLFEIIENVAMLSKTAWLVLSWDEEGHWQQRFTDETPQQAGLVERPGESIYTEPLFYGGTVYIFGAGHVSQALVPILIKLGFFCYVIDDREKLLDMPAFAGTAKTSCNLAQFSRYFTIGHDDYVCILTRGHVYDYEVQRQVLPMQPYYIGVIGSKAKLAFVRQKLLEDGFTAAEIDACHAPIGLPISAATPEEIAISIAAELIALRARQEGREKSDAVWIR